MSLDVDPALVDLYVGEVGDHVASLAAQLLHLERHRDAPEALDEVFRLMHSVKGAAAAMGYTDVADLAHRLEDVFDGARRGSGSVDAGTVDVALAGVDLFEAHVADLRSGGSGRIDTSAVMAGAAALSAVRSEPPSAMPPPVVATPSAETSGTHGAVAFEVEFAEGAEPLDLRVRSAADAAGRHGEVIDIVPDPDDLMWEHQPLVTITVATADPSTVRAALDGIDGARVTDVGRPDPGPSAPTADPTPTADPPPPTAISPAAEPPPAARSTGPAETAAPHTVRVDVERLDAVLDLAGELVTARGQLEQLQRELDSAVLAATDDGLPALRRQVSELSATLADSVADLGRISDRLQGGVMGLRLVPLAPLFSRLQRVVRDISQQTGRPVDVEIRGESTELDKQLADQLAEPLTHLIRNAIDHGIEPPEERVRLGKPPNGQLRIEASHRGNSVYVQVSDDGAGIDPERVRARLIASGRMTADEVGRLSDGDVVNQLFEPGLSTADAITDISGRGVGLDAARTRIAALKGSLDVRSEVGRGTVFTARLPLTMAILQGLVVRSGDQHYGLPIDEVQEVVALDPAAVLSFAGRNSLDLRGRYIPLVEVEACLGLTEPSDDLTHGYAVVVHTTTGRLGLLIDSPVGTADLVIRSLAENFSRVRGLTGASVLADGNVALVLDTADLADVALM